MIHQPKKLCGLILPAISLAIASWCAYSGDYWWAVLVVILNIPTVMYVIAAATTPRSNDVKDNKQCKARQHSDQMLCECGLGWDMNDPDPPECRKGVVARQELTAMRATLQEPSRFASVQRRLLKLQEMPLRWLPTTNIEEGLYLVQWASLPDAVFVLVSARDEERVVRAKAYHFFNQRGRLMLVVERTDHPATQFRYRYKDGEWLSE